MQLVRFCHHICGISVHLLLPIAVSFSVCVYLVRAPCIAYNSLLDVPYSCTYI